MILDTHVLVWAMLNDARLGTAAKGEIDRLTLGSGLGISAITPWELALLVEKKRLAFAHDLGSWIRAVLRLPGFFLAPIDTEIAIDSVRFPGMFHADPADRLLIATARQLDRPLLTADRAILTYGAAGFVQVIDAALQSTSFPSTGMAGKGRHESGRP